ncbi:MAG: succinate dehydrogenase, cytochrome b556 subunit [Casimicrobiaceae bacterium]
MTGPHRTRGHASSRAALAHRLSGLVLALFLPAHFWALGTSLQGEAALESTLAWTSSPLVKLAEWGLVVLLALHLSLGLRVLALEFLPWHRSQGFLAAVALAVAALCGVAYAAALAGAS